MRDAAFEEWVEEARGLRIEKALDLVAPGHAISKKTRYVGPCPGCGGVDRFSLNMRKNIFWCRKSAEGGDAIALARHVTGLDFLAAVELLTGNPPPGRATSEEEKAARRRRVAELEQKRAAEAARMAAEESDFRSREIARAHKIWRAAGPVARSMAADYLAHRGLGVLPGAKIRGGGAVPYWHHIDGEWRQIYEGPAMVAAIQNNNGLFIGCHITWIDPGLATSSGKAEIVHPKTGELLDAKKVRGSQKGGHIMLGGAYSDIANRLVIGEGIETVLSVAQAEIAAARILDRTVYWAAVNLHNIGGKSAGSMPHPTLTLTDSRGRTRAQRVPGPAPDLEDLCVLAPPDWADDILLLGDGDSDRLTTRNTLLRFAGRWARPGRNIRAAWAEDGLDFSDMLRGAA